MTNLKLKKVSTLLGVSALALCALSADPTISGSSYTMATDTISDTGSVDQSLYSKTIVNLEDVSDYGTTMYMQNYFVFDDSDDLSLDVNEIYVRFDAAEDEFGNNFALQAGRDTLSMGAADWYNAGDVIAASNDSTSTSYETWNMYAEVPVMSSENSSLLLTPFVKAAYDSSADGYGLIANYAMTQESGLTGLEAVGYYTDSDVRLSATVQGTLGVDFALTGNVLANDLSDFDISAYVTTTVDDFYMSLDVLYQNAYEDDDTSTVYSTLTISPELDYTVSDTVSVGIDNTTTINVDDSTVSNWGELYSTMYLADDFYVKPSLASGFTSDDLVEVAFKVYKSF